MRGPAYGSIDGSSATSCAALNMFGCLGAGWVVLSVHVQRPSFHTIFCWVWALCFVPKSRTRSCRGVSLNHYTTCILRHEESRIHKGLKNMFCDEHGTCYGHYGHSSQWPMHCAQACYGSVGKETLKSFSPCFATTGCHLTASAFL